MKGENKDYIKENEEPKSKKQEETKRTGTDILLLNVLYVIPWIFWRSPTKYK